MLKKVYNEVSVLLKADNSGHGMEHIERVVNLSTKFASSEKANIQIVSLIAYLHDVDDYKLFGQEYSDNLINTRNILNKLDLSNEVKNQIINEVKAIGYSKRLKGLCPKTIEGMVVSDADMCDSIGATGIIRSTEYSLSRGNKFFDKNIWPIEDITYANYIKNTEGTVITHVFEKLLKLSNLMLTNSGKKEACERHKFMIALLRQYFNEQGLQKWNEYLDDYVKKLTL